MHDDNNRTKLTPLMLEINAAERFGVLESRVRAKQSDYDRYQFTEEERRALNIFFDLSQEYQSIDDFYSICVLLPRLTFGSTACLYIRDEDLALTRVRCSQFPSSQPSLWQGSENELHKGPLVRDATLNVPIRANPHLLAQLPFDAGNDLIGVLELHADEFTEHRVLFYEKFANRIGFQLCNKLLFLKNQEHLDFIQRLVRDIGHNVIVPNMYFKLLFKQLEGKIKALAELRNDMDESRPGSREAMALAPHALKLDYVTERLREQYEEIYAHYSQTSLFLETLLRGSHFEKGKYVVVRQACNLAKRIIAPQVDRFHTRFEERGIKVSPESGPQGDVPEAVPADVGLISQVVANFFSNAVKYTREAPLNGRTEKSLRYHWRVEQDFFGLGQDGLRVEVLTTGKPIPPNEREHLFEPEFRGKNTHDEYGTGHGLHFVRGIVELHGGRAGYETWDGGNCFYFVLPMTTPLPTVHSAAPPIQP